ncbi:hypothetical protein ACFGVR_20690 [Mucilaginibacter sp. AW1-3]
MKTLKVLLIAFVALLTFGSAKAQIVLRPHVGPPPPPPPHPRIVLHRPFHHRVVVVRHHYRHDRYHHRY